MSEPRYAAGRWRITMLWLVAMAAIFCQGWIEDQRNHALEARVAYLSHAEFTIPLGDGITVPAHSVARFKLQIVDVEIEPLSEEEGTDKRSSFDPWRSIENRVRMGEQPGDAN